MAFANENDLEPYSILWLDSNVNQNDSNQNAQQQQLRTIINHLRTFNNVDVLERYMQCVPKEQRLVLIVNDPLGQQIVPNIHNLPQVSSIYVYNRETVLNEQWIESFSKIRAVHVRFDELISTIRSDHQLRVKTEESLSMNFFTPNGGYLGQSTTGLNSYFVHFQLFTDVLLRLKSNETDRKEFIAMCKENYKENQSKLSIIKEFEQTYSSSQVLHWYIRESFFKKVLNTALRKQDTKFLILLRSFIVDIGQLLIKYQLTTSIRVYRGQLMSKAEFEELKPLIGEFLSINTFMSCSIKKNTALQYTKKWDNTNDFVQVLFEIDADPGMTTDKPFGNISEYNDFSPENEILFMPWSIFRLIDVLQRTIDQIWIIRMRLCGNGEKDLKQFFNYMKKENGDGETNSYLLGKALRRMSKLDLAEKYLLQSLNERPTHHFLIGELYCNLGLIANDKSDYEVGFQWYQKSLDFYMKTCPDDYATIGSIHKNIGELFRKSGNRSRALQSYNMAVSLFEQTHDKTNPKMADFYNSIAHVYQQSGEYLTALKFYEKSLAIQQKYLPSNHLDLSESYSSLGLVHASLGHFDLALKYHERSLNNKLKSLPPQHPDIAISHRNIGFVYANKGKFEQALTYLRQAATLFHQTLPPEHPHVVQIEQDIKRVTRKMK